MAYSARLGGPLAVGTSSTTIFTVPTGRLYVVRSLTVLLQSMAANSLVLFAANSTANANRLLRRTFLNDDTALINELRWVFTAGETLVALHGGTLGQCTVSAHGYNLAG